MMVSKMLSDEQKKRLKEDFDRFIRFEAMSLGCYQDELEEIILGYQLAS